MDGRFFKRLINESFELPPAVLLSFAGVLLLRHRVIVNLHIIVAVKVPGPVNFGIYRRVLALTYFIKYSNFGLLPTGLIGRS